MIERTSKLVHREVENWIWPLLCIWLACALCATPAQGVAQASQRTPEPSCREHRPYQSLVDIGLDAFHANNFGLARECFVHAHAQLASARTLRALGMTDLALENYSLARQELEGALTHPINPLTEEQCREVSELLEWMRNGLGVVRLEYRPRIAVAAVDDKPAAPGDLMLELGEHQLRIEAPGYRPYRQRFGIAAGQPPLRLQIVLIKAPPPVDADRSNTWLWIGAGGAAAVAVGGTLCVLGEIALAKVRAPDASPHRTVDDGISQLHTGRTLTRVGFVTGGVGLLGLASALVLRLTPHHSPRQPEHSWTYELGFARFDVKGRF